MKNLARTLALFVLVALTVLTFSACGKSPTGPSSLPVMIYPTGITVLAPGGSQNFAATEGDGKNYTWTVDGATRSDCANTKICRFTAGPVGVHIIVVSSASNSAQATIQVTTDPAVSISSANPPYGSQMTFGTRISFGVSYVNANDSVDATVSFVTSNGSVMLIDSSSTTGQLGSGSVLVQATVSDGKVVGGSTLPSPVTTTILRVRLYQISNYTLLAQADIPATYVWK